MKIHAGQSGREVISLQKADSLLVFECKAELKGFLQYGTSGIRSLHVKGGFEWWRKLNE